MFICVFRESGNIEEAYKHLQEHAQEICDKVQLLELTGTYLLLLEKFKDAVSIYEELIGRNQENNSYFEHYILAKQLTQVRLSLSVNYPINFSSNYFSGKRN